MKSIRVAFVLVLMFVCLFSFSLLGRGPVNAGPTVNAQGRHSFCQPGLGGEVFSTGRQIELRILASNADFVDEIRLVSPTQIIIGTNKEIGKTVRLGPFRNGSELIFQIHARDTGQTFTIGPASRNPDNLAHANVTCLGDQTIIKFEDYFGGGDLDYDDAIFQVTIGPTPECDTDALANLIANDKPLTTITTQAATDWQIEQLQDDLQAAMPFIITDDKGRQRLLRDDALAAGVSIEALNLAQRLVNIANRIAKSAAKDEEVDQLKGEDFDFIDPLFRKWANNGRSNGPSQHQPSTQLSLLPRCGGFINPTPCPARVNSGLVFSSREEVTNHLLSLGYHIVPRYATVPGGFKNDFAFVLNDSDCGTGPFRNEAALLHRGECWTYYTQGPEPNPEIFSYAALWPNPWWPEYVFWWHRFYC